MSPMAQQTTNALAIGAPPQLTIRPEVFRSFASQPQDSRKPPEEAITGDVHISPLIPGFAPGNLLQEGLILFAAFDLHRTEDEQINMNIATTYGANGTPVCEPVEGGSIAAANWWLATKAIREQRMMGIDHTVEPGFNAAVHGASIKHWSRQIKPLGFMRRGNYDTMSPNFNETAPFALGLDSGRYHNIANIWHDDRHLHDGDYLYIVLGYKIVDSNTRYVVSSIDTSHNAVVNYSLPGLGEPIGLDLRPTEKAIVPQFWTAVGGSTVDRSTNAYIRVAEKNILHTDLWSRLPLGDDKGKAYDPKPVAIKQAETWHVATYLSHAKPRQTPTYFTNKYKGIDTVNNMPASLYHRLPFIGTVHNCQSLHKHESF
jgi:hypothetical protein